MKTAIVYMVAGMSSRFGGRVKQFAKVGPEDETLIEYSINQAIKAGFNEIVFIVGDKTEDSFKEMFGDEYKGIKVVYAKQTFDSNVRKKPWGTVDALVSAKDIIDCPFVVCNGDDIYGEEAFKKLHDHLEKSASCATVGYRLGKSIPENGSVTRGIFKVEKDDVLSIEETFEISRDKLKDLHLEENDLCSMNIFALTLDVLELLDKRLKEFKEEHEAGDNAECLLPTELSSLIEQGYISMTIYPTSESCIGVTNPEDEEKVKELLKNK